jgi:glutathione S-transferase
MTPSLKMYALAAAILALHLLALALWTGTVRVMKKRWINPEDAKLNKGELSEADDPAVQRVKRAHQNAIENAVPFFAVGFLYAATGPTQQGMTIYFGTFVAARILHSVFYLWGRQPFRTLMFAIGVLATIGMSVQVILAAV